MSYNFRLTDKLCQMLNKERKHMRVDSQITDRRYRRSNRLLKEAFLELMREKGFTSMTIQDITDRADVNRGTFYAHFPDKYALLEQSIRDKFMRLLNQELPDSASWNQKHLRILVQAVLEHFKEMHGRCYPVDTVNPLFEHAVQEELCALLTHWMRKAKRTAGEWPVPVETIALMTSWGIFGARRIGTEEKPGRRSRKWRNESCPLLWRVPLNQRLISLLAAIDHNRLLNVKQVALERMPDEIVGLDRVFAHFLVSVKWRTRVQQSRLLRALHSL
ncbi:TetR/AcrR family transcriptional regulator [Cohnella cholangitidis]|uniref:TetR/AcrR family transcriptional regulator n=1 Tax=Cohnella cholangitidis TaxID=2598458 RepID=A0A7G5C637_9BACL|nr:TetR/AcrR family transcriptional regulator [Cohnella cholangitidis]